MVLGIIAFACGLIGVLMIAWSVYRDIKSRGREQEGVDDKGSAWMFVGVVVMMVGFPLAALSPHDQNVFALWLAGILSPLSLACMVMIGAVFYCSVKSLFHRPFSDHNAPDGVKQSS